MKTLFLLPLLAATSLWAADSDYSVVSLGPNERLLSRTVETTWQDGSRTKARHYLVELASGMNFMEGGVWVPTRAIFEAVPGGAAAVHGQHKILLAANLNTFGAVDLESPGGQHFKSHLLCMALTDRASGKSVRIADVQDCQGVLVGDNQVVYKNAFSGGCVASVVYTYTQFGFDQEVHWQANLPHAPQEYSLDPATTRLEIWTEVVAAPPILLSARVVGGESDPVKRLAMAAPDLVDQTFDVDSMHFGSGRAFTIGLGDDADSIPVVKTYELRDKRRFLIESVSYLAIRESLALLPPVAAPAAPDGAKVSVPNPRLRGLARQFPAAPPAAGKTPKPVTRLASLGAGEKTLVLDYTTVITTNNYLFKADVCYYLS